jgi:Ankyrin repeats (3 copies)/SET domain
MIETYGLEPYLSYTAEKKIPYPASIVVYALREKIPLKEGFFRIINKKAHGEWCNEKFTPYHLTLLHISVIMGMYDATKGLLKSGADPNQPDKKNWTPLHHAALWHHKRLIALLLKHGSDEHRKNNCQATYYDILSFTQAPPYHPEETIPLLIEKKGGLKLATQREFKEKTGAQYIGETFYEQKKYLDGWINECFQYKSFPFQEDFIHAYESFKKPAFSIKAVTSDDKHSLSPGFGLFAEEDIAQGTILGEYHGKVLVKVKRGSVYALGDNKDGAKYRNEMAMINDGFPNCVLLPLTCVKGQPNRELFIASEAIKKGEQILWNYGEHYVKIIPRMECRYKDICTFVDSFDSCHLKKLLFRLRSNLKVTLDEFYLIEKYRYIVSTPSILYQLIVSGRISIDKGRDLADVMSTLLNFLNDPCNNPIFDVSKQCRIMIIQLEEKGYKKTAELCSSTFLGWLTQFDLGDLIDKADFMVKKMQKLLSNKTLTSRHDPDMFLSSKVQELLITGEF